MAKPGKSAQPKMGKFPAEAVMRRRFVLIGLFFALTAVGVFSSSYLELTSQMFFNPDDYGFGVTQQVGRLVVGPINPTGPAATLQTGDELVSLDGEYIRYQTDLITAFRRHQPDSSYSIVVRRHGQLLHFTLRQDTPSLGFYIRRLIFISGPICFLLMGLLVILLKPDDKAALLLGLWFAAMSNGFPAELFMLLPGWLMWVVVASTILRWLFVPLFLHFFLIFPEESPALHRFPRLEWYLYVPYLLIFLPHTAIYLVLWAISPDQTHGQIFQGHIIYLPALEPSYRHTVTSQQRSPSLVLTIQSAELWFSIGPMLHQDRPEFGIEGTNRPGMIQTCCCTAAITLELQITSI